MYKKFSKLSDIKSHIYDGRLFSVSFPIPHKQVEIEISYLTLDFLWFRQSHLSLIHVSSFSKFRHVSSVMILFAIAAFNGRKRGAAVTERDSKARWV